MNFNIRLLYLYLFSFVGLLILVIGSIRLIDLGIKMAFFKDADYYESYYPEPAEGQPQVSPEEKQELMETQVRRNRQQEFSGAVSMVLVGLPLYLYHWGKINQEYKKKSELSQK